MTLSKVLIIDVESTCWPSEKAQPKTEPSEIIEIGICPLSLPDKVIGDKHSILVKPERSKVSDFCQQLTGLTQAQVDHGISFQGACDILKAKYQSHKHVWASYGDYDKTMFEHMIMRNIYNAEYPLNRRHINVKTLFAVRYGLPKEIGMKEALAYIGLPLDGKHHRGCDDAYNIAKILRMILL